MPAYCVAATLALGSTGASATLSGVDRSVELQQASVLPPLRSALSHRASRYLALQVALDRTGFSPGEIDAAAGDNTLQALRAFQRARGLIESGQPDEPTILTLGATFAAPLVEYVVTEQDVAGPFVKIGPGDMMELAKLETLAYQSPVELLAERFHCSPALLKRLNPTAKFIAGARLLVPAVEPFVVPATRDVLRELRAPNAAASRVVVAEATRTLTVTGESGAIVFHAPVSIGSTNDPLPKGEWTVTGTAVLPTFFYNPALFWDADPTHAKAKIAPGPNSPVGVVWVDLSKEHLGFHGTPEPAQVGRAQSHGCIRLTNWDAMRLATLVNRGSMVTLQ